MSSLYQKALITFKILIVLISIVSLYILVHKLYEKNYKLIHSWHFPMLIAICLETLTAI